MRAMKIGRRELVKGLGMGILAVSPAGRRILWAAEPDALIRIQNSYAPGQWFYDPAGLYIQKGQTVRWQAFKWGATVTAYHPANGNHELRIPRDAKPFDSGILSDGKNVAGKFDKNTFDWTFDVEGTYDYYSRNHEILGMVGRIVVGKPGGPAEEKPLGYGGVEGKTVVFPAQVKLMAKLSSAEIVEKKKIPYPRDLLVIPSPWGER